MLAKRELQVIEFIPKYIDFGGKKFSQEKKRKQSDLSRRQARHRQKQAATRIKGQLVRQAEICIID